MRRRAFRISETECADLLQAMNALIQETIKQTQQHLDDGGDARNSDSHFDVLRKRRDLACRLIMWQHANYPKRGGKRK